MTKQLLTIFLAGIILLSLTQCQRDDVTISGVSGMRAYNIQAPVFRANLNGIDIVSRIEARNYLFYDESGLIKLQLDTTFAIYNSTIVEFPEIKLDAFYDLANPKKSTRATLVFNDSLVISPMAEQQFDSILVQNGTMQFSFETPSGIDGAFVVEFPGVRRSNGEVLSFSGQLGQPVSQQHDMAGAMMYMVQKADGFSALEVVTTVTTLDQTTIPNGTQLHLQTELQNFEPQVMWGYFGQMPVLAVNNSVDLPIFSQISPANKLEFKGADLQFTIHNYLGIPLNLSVDTLSFVRKSYQNEVLLTYDNQTNMRVDAAEYANPVSPANNVYLVDSTNSNINEVVNIYPDHLYMKGDVTINPDGPVQKNFIVNNLDTAASVNAKFTIPFWFKTSQYSRIDTVAFSIESLFGDSTNLDYLDFIAFYFDFENGLPFNITAQVYLVNDDGLYVDSLFNCQNNPPLTCDEHGGYIIWKSGTPEEPYVARVDAIIDQELAKKMFRYKTTQLYIHTWVSTGNIDNPDFVQIKVANYLKTRFAFEMKSLEN